jgi:hypothetical protein
MRQHGATVGAMTACTVARMRASITKLFIASTLAFAGCVADEVTEAPTSTDDYALSCTPGYETCDYGCNFDGAQWNGPTPTTDDCIIRCNAAGNGWELVVNCGWAQNFPYSSSCLDSQPHPVCQNN